MTRPEGIEKQLEKIGEIMDGLTEHAELTDKRIELLLVTQHNTNESMQALVSSIRDLIDRIPPENLR